MKLDPLNSNEYFYRSVILDPKSLSNRPLKPELVCFFQFEPPHRAEGKLVERAREELKLLTDFTEKIQSSV